MTLDLHPTPLLLSFLPPSSFLPLSPRPRLQHGAELDQGPQGIHRLRKDIQARAEPQEGRPLNCAQEAGRHRPSVDAKGWPRLARSVVYRSGTLLTRQLVDLHRVFRLRSTTALRSRWSPPPRLARCVPPPPALRPACFLPCPPFWACSPSLRMRSAAWDGRADVSLAHFIAHSSPS